MSGDMTLENGIIFPSTKLLRKALRRYSVHKSFDYLYLKNDKIRVQARFVEDDCKFYLFASNMPGDNGIQIKSFILEHTCRAHYENTKCNVEFLAHQYLPNFKDNPNWSTQALKGQIRRNFHIEVLLHRCYKAKRLARLMVHGNQTEQFKFTGQYALALEKWNPRTTVILTRSGDHFRRIYICLAAYKASFKHCKPIVCVDGCHLKG